ncbi:MAG TPA: hypothetical protein PKL83_04670, partial [bacterium]|nr:hypothetical protein [bacterium]
GFGNACNWDYWAYMDGLLVDDCPRIGDTFVYDVQGCPGHVASVEQVLWEEGKIEVSEMNWCSTCLQTKQYLNTNRKFIHGYADSEVVIYPDPPNEVAEQFAAAGSCNGKPDFHAAKAGTYEVNLTDAEVIHIPDGWSVTVNSSVAGDMICLTNSGLLEEYTYPFSQQPVADNIARVTVSTVDSCNTK